MTYLITALDAEARAIIEYYRLKRVSPLPYTLYEGENILLLVTGMGKINALMSVSALLGWRRPSSEDTLINIGICGAPDSFTIGEPLLVHQIIDGERHYYPDILYSHPLRETSIMCVDTPQTLPCYLPVDMESGGIFCAASKFFKLHQLAFLKIVSDHCNPDSVTKEGVIELIRSHLSIINDLCSNLNRIQPADKLFNNAERLEIDMVKTYFTKSQGDALEDAFCFFRLKYPTRLLPLHHTPIPDSKRERSLLLEKLITTLTA